MAKVYIVYTVIDFVRDYGNLIESFEITSSKQIEYDNWHGATYLTKVKFNMANGLKNITLTIRADFDSLRWATDKSIEGETVGSAIQKILEENWHLETRWI